MRHVGMKAALNSMGSRVGLGCVSQSYIPSQSLFTILAGGKQQWTDCGSRQKTGAQSPTMAARARRPQGGLKPGLRGDNYSRINTPETFTVLMQTMDRQTIIMQRVHHVLIVAFHLLM